MVLNHFGLLLLLETNFAVSPQFSCIYSLSDFIDYFKATRRTILIDFVIEQLTAINSSLISICNFFSSCRLLPLRSHTLRAGEVKQQSFFIQMSIEGANLFHSSECLFELSLVFWSLLHHLQIWSAFLSRAHQAGFLTALYKNLRFPVDALIRS